MNSEKHTLRLLFTYNKKNFLRYLTLSLGTMLVSLFGVLWSESFRRMVNGADSASYIQVIQGFSIAFFVFFIDSFTQLLCSYYGSKLDNSTSALLQADLVKKLLHCDSCTVHEKGSSYYIKTIVHFAPSIQHTVNKNLRDIVNIAFSLIVTVGYLFVLDYPLSVGITFLSVFLPLLANVLAKRIANRYSTLQEMTIHRDAHVHDYLEGIIEIRQFKLHKYVREQLDRLNLKILKISKPLFFMNNGIKIYNTMLHYICLIFILSYGGYRLYVGKIELGDLIAIIYSANRVYDPLTAISSMWASIQAELVKANTVFSILECKPSRRLKCQQADKNRIVINDLSFGYAPDKETIKKVSFEVNQGEITVLAGANGSGKSTMAKLLAGLLTPTQGKIVVNIMKNSMTADNLVVGYIPQEPMIFKGTIRDNILLGNTSISNKELFAAIHAAGLDKFIKQLPEGLNFELSERGSNVSSGELQRICIARALVYNSPVLILDEHTTHVGSNYEKAILSSIRNVAKEKIVVLVAHRLEVIKESDKVVFFNNGSIEEIGSYEQLVANRKGFFRFISHRGG